MCGDSGCRRHGSRGGGREARDVEWVGVLEGRGIAVKLELDAIDFVCSQGAWHSPCV